MQFSKIAFAVAAVCAATAATAGPIPGRIGLSAGASAVQNNVRLAVLSLCKAPNVGSSFVNGNFTTVVCADVPVTAGTYTGKPNSEFRNFDGLTDSSGLPVNGLAEVRFNVANGSFGSVQILNPSVNPAFTFLNPGTGLTTDPTMGGVVLGGISDIEPERFPAATIGANNPRSNGKLGAAQTFGVAASLALYTKMFDAQKASNMIPASCTVNDTSIKYCIPTIFKAQMATIMANNEFNAAYAKGLGFLTGVPADDGTELRYVRRVDTSGTQGSAQNYFLGLPCSANQLSIVPEPTTIDPAGGTIANVKIENIRVYGAGGTSNVRTELNKAGVFALGIVSGENDQTAQGWRWLRTDGAPIGENAVPGTAGNTNANTQKDGSSSFYFEAVYVYQDTWQQANWLKIAEAFGGLVAPVGLVNQTQLDVGYTKSGLTCLGSSSL